MLSARGSGWHVHDRITQCEELRAVDDLGEEVGQVIDGTDERDADLAGVPKQKGKSTEPDWGSRAQRCISHSRSCRCGLECSEPLKARSRSALGDTWLASSGLPNAFASLCESKISSPLSWLIASRSAAPTSEMDTQAGITSTATRTACRCDIHPISAAISRIPVLHTRPYLLIRYRSSPRFSSKLERAARLAALLVLRCWPAAGARPVAYRCVPHQLWSHHRRGPGCC